MQSLVVLRQLQRLAAEGLVHTAAETQKNKAVGLKGAETALAAAVGGWKQLHQARHIDPDALGHWVQAVSARQRDAATHAQELSQADEVLYQAHKDLARAAALETASRASFRQSNRQMLRKQQDRELHLIEDRASLRKRGS